MSRIDSPGEKLKVLVVDDDPRLRSLFHELLSTGGFAVDYAADGRSALQRIRGGSYAVILLDLFMPDVTGFDLIERLGRDSPALLRRLIVMTGAPQSEIDRVDTKHVWGVLRKPLDAAEVARSARLCADGQRPPKTA